MKKNILSETLPHNTRPIIFVLLSLMPIIGMAVDLISPSLPAIADGLNVPHQTAKNAISIYLLGYALGNFFTGICTDVWGRQSLMRINLLAFVLISLLPVLFPRIEILLLSRFLQGVTIGAIAVITRATFSDILPFDKLINLGTLIVGVSGLSPIVGPILGGYLQHYFGWKASFCFLSVITFLLLTLIFLIVPETHINRSELKIIVIKKNLSQICKNSLFVGMAALMGVNYSFLIIFNTMGPFLIQTEWKYSAIFYGHIAFCLGCAFLLSSFTCRHYLKKYRIERLFFVVIHSTLACSLILFVLALFFSSSIILTIFSSSIMFFNCGFIFSMSIGKTLSLFRHMAGAAAAMLYTIDITIASLISMLTSFIHVGSFIPMMTIYLLLSIGCTLIYWFIFKTKLNNEEQPRLER